MKKDVPEEDEKYVRNKCLAVCIRYSQERVAMARDAVECDQGEEEKGKGEDQEEDYEDVDEV